VKGLSSVISLVIFDCDGVLFDSAGANVAYYDAVLERLGRPPLDEAWARRAHFLSSRQLYEAMFGDDVAFREEALRVGREVDYGPFYKLMRPMPDLEHVLQVLAPHYRLAMATNRGGTAAGVVREFALDRWLTLTVGANDVARAKPHPDMLLHCLEHFRLPPTSAAYVGDSETDHQAALAANIRFIGFGPVAPAEHRVQSLRDLPAMLESLKRT
jgi:phosphoglycolate phosphatase-like HAD superfamily hydrolase